MRIVFQPWFHPFDLGWNLCSYQSKNGGVPDQLTNKIIDFKENNPEVRNAFTRWSIEHLSNVTKEIKIDYSIRSLGRGELTINPDGSLHKLGEDISRHFGYKYVPDLIGKKRVTKHLVGLKKVEREKELEDVYFINNNKIDLSKRSILLIDDLRTSGTTSGNIHRLLSENFKDFKCYLFVIGRSNEGTNGEEVFQVYAKHEKG